MKKNEMGKIFSQEEYRAILQRERAFELARMRRDGYTPTRLDETTKDCAGAARVACAV